MCKTQTRLLKQTHRQQTHTEHDWDLTVIPAKVWLEPRPSDPWILYLSDPDWKAGGELLTGFHPVFHLAGYLSHLKHLTVCCYALAGSMHKKLASTVSQHQCVGASGTSRCTSQLQIFLQRLENNVLPQHFGVQMFEGKSFSMSCHVSQFFLN